MAVVWSVNPLLKELVGRSRPDLWPLTEPASEYSFPSGHAANTAALAFALLMLSRNHRLLATFVAVVALTVVAWSQLALGRHYPSDILMRLALGSRLDRLPRTLPASIWPADLTRRMRKGGPDESGPPSAVLRGVRLSRTGHLTETVAPAPSRASLAFSAAALSTFSRMAFGALSTRSLASFRPRLVRPRTSLMTWIFLS